jgi:CRP-like cAMP-binding protein
MDTTLLETYISSFTKMSVEKAKLFAQSFSFEAFPKNHVLIEEDKINTHTFILETGYVRSFTLNQDGDEVTTNLFSAPCFANDFLSFFKQIPASETFQTLTPCRLWKMDFNTVQTHFHTYPEFREFGRLMLVSNYSQLHQRMLGMIKDTAEKRYLNLIKQHPEIFQNVPLKMIASYLGITDTSLSRIRKETAKK